MADITWDEFIKLVRDEDSKKWLEGKNIGELLEKIEKDKENIKKIKICCHYDRSRSFLKENQFDSEVELGQFLSVLLKKSQQGLDVIFTPGVIAGNPIGHRRMEDAVRAMMGGSSGNVESEAASAEEEHEGLEEMTVIIPPNFWTTLIGINWNQKWENYHAQAKSNSYC